jgi:hypothetical protein
MSATNLSTGLTRIESGSNGRCEKSSRLAVTGVGVGLFAVAVTRTVIEPEHRRGFAELASGYPRRDRADRRTGRNGPYTLGAGRAVRRSPPVGDRRRSLPLTTAVRGVDNGLLLGVTRQDVVDPQAVRSTSIEGTR